MTGSRRVVWVWAAVAGEATGFWKDGLDLGRGGYILLDGC